MNLNCKISAMLMVSFLSFSACSEMKSNDCISCTKKSVPESVQPDKKTAIELKNDVSKPLALATKGPLVITKSEGRVPAGDTTSSKDSYQQAFCDKYEMAQDRVDVKQIIKEMEASPYADSMKDFWITSACHAPKKNDVLVPILFNTATDIVRSETFPKVVHDYFVTKKNDQDTWLKAINTQTNDGYTFLDFIQYNIERNNYGSKDLMDAAQRIVSYLCQNNGVYSKYKYSVKCH